MIGPDAGILSSAIQESAKDIRVKAQLEAASQRIDEITAKLQRVSAAEAAVATASEVPRGDWTSIYAQWSSWEDVEELSNLKEKEEARMTEILERPSFMGHYHDHSEERKFFELPESSKMSLCERHRQVGNHLFEEGLLPKAAEQYQLALSYYEYCFPESEDDQFLLNELRRACMCNISLCYCRMGHLREAVEVAGRVIQEDPRDCKALYRRAQAYLALDEYRYFGTNITTCTNTHQK